MKLLAGLIFLAAVAFVAIVVMVVAIAAIRRGGRHGSSGLMSSAALEVQSLLEPEKRHAAMAQKVHGDEEQDDESGEPPDR